VERDEEEKVEDERRRWPRLTNTVISDKSGRRLLHNVLAVSIVNISYQSK
jgi:hypothetical protein